MQSAPTWSSLRERFFRVPKDRIFISYRRNDRDAWWLAANIRTAFGEERVFLDTRNIEPSRRFADEIELQLRTCSVVIAVIGLAWQRRTPDLHNEHDWVRKELEFALTNGAVVIPVFLGVNASELRELPAALQPLLTLQGATFRAVPPGISAGELHDQWDVSLRRLLDAIRKNGFRRKEFLAAATLAGSIALSVSLLILLIFVLIAPLYAATLIGADWRLFAAPIAIALVAMAMIAVGLEFAPHAMWSRFANLGGHGTALAAMPVTSLVLLGALYLSQPFSVTSSNGISPLENPCDRNYQVKRFDTISADPVPPVDQLNPCETEFNKRLTIIEMRIGRSFSTLAKGRIEVSTRDGRIKAIRVPLAITLIEDANSSGVLSLPFELSALDGVSTPFVIWVATEPQGKPVSASLKVGDQP